MRRSQVVAIVVGVVVAGVFVWFVKRHGDKRDTTAATARDAGDDGDDDAGYRVIDSDARLALLQRIAAARAAREAKQAGQPVPAVPAPSADDPPPLPGALSAEDVKNGIMELVPLFDECYTAAVERKTITTANVSFNMTIVGEPAIGTLVDHADIGGDAAVLADPELMTCLHETLMSIELPPMTAGATLIVKTGMGFRPP